MGDVISDNKEVGHDTSLQSSQPSQNFSKNNENSKTNTNLFDGSSNVPNSSSSILSSVGLTCIVIGMGMYFSGIEGGRAVMGGGLLVCCIFDRSTQDGRFKDREKEQKDDKYVEVDFKKDKFVLGQVSARKMPNNTPDPKNPISPKTP